MCDSFYEPSDHWSDDIYDGYDNSYSVSVDERMAADPVTYEELEYAWNSYADEDNVQPTSESASSSQLDILIDYMMTTYGNADFNVRLRDGTVWKGYMFRNVGFHHNVSETLLSLYPNPSYNYTDCDNFTSPRNLVNFVLLRTNQTLLDNYEEDPLEFIWTIGDDYYMWTIDDDAKSWYRILRELNNNMQ